MSTAIAFRPTETDTRIIEEAQKDGETRSDVIRRALRHLDQEEWLKRFHEESVRLTDENLNTEPDAW
ncbi:MAG: hypothetical protein LBN10_08035 [Propionibacteriaceae bacterium]|jgi:antitoxin ParD1/3/4|nr:hypothetical protein [Propionibacteriaceae bacterium]